MKHDKDVKKINPFLLLMSHKKLCEMGENEKKRREKITSQNENVRMLMGDEHEH